jgi:AAA domain
MNQETPNTVHMTPEEIARGTRMRADAEQARRQRRANGADEHLDTSADLHWYTAADLQWMEFPPLQFIIPGYLVEGLTILVGKPKRGKSWMALDWVLAVAHGGYAFGTIQCDEGDCLYMALEDSQRRMKRRIKQLLPHADEWSPRLTLCHKMKRLDRGGLDEVRAWASSVPLPRLVVVDTFTRVRPARDKNETPYDADYRAMSLLQDLATELRIAIVVIHHQRKLESDDPLDTASGSTGLTGAADSVLVLGRDGQGTTLNGRGRDIDDIEVALSFDKTTGRWSILGDAQEIRRSESRSAILAALKAAPEPLTPAEIAIRTGIDRNAVDAQLHRMMKAAEVLSRTRGRYAHPDN